MLFRSPLVPAALLFCGALLLPAPSLEQGLLCALLAGAAFLLGATAARGAGERPRGARGRSRAVALLLLVPLGYFPLGLFVSSAEALCRPGRGLEAFLEDRGGRLVDPAGVTGRLDSEPTRAPEIPGACLLEIQ
ncbi:MAG: hypothetical protein L0323_24355, partial [Planctomycetes bacterium]|nr:hypothetical protein [Planctomycetota bacterium]